MPIDGIFLNLLKHEIEDTALGSRVEKVHQPSKDELVLLLRSRAGSKRLLLSASANSSRIHFTENAPDNPPNPPMLCMLLRKHLTGAVLTGLRQAELDRVLLLDFDAFDSIGDRVKYSLCAEIMAKHSNIILIDEAGLTVDAVKRIDFTKSQVRQILPGLPYVLPPPQNKANLSDADTRRLAEKVALQSGKTLSSALLSVIQGMSPLVCRELAERVTGGDDKASDLTEKEFEKLAGLLETLKETLLSGNAAGCLLKNAADKPVEFSYMEIQQYGSTYACVKYKTLSAMLDDFYTERDRLDRTRQRAADMIKVVNNAVAKISRKLVLQHAELEACADRESLRVKAELIGANQYRLEKGALYYDLENYYDENKLLRIPANPALSPSANSQKYYKEYRKAKTAEQMLTALIEQGRQELQYLETVSEAIARASSGAELDEIRSELTQSGYLKNRRKKEAKTEKPLPPLEYMSKDGFKILAGRNNLQNDRLSLRDSDKNDLWLHAQKMPGSHVVISAGGREIPPSTIEYAAAVAAYHSRARESSLVPVDYTLVKNLKKPPGSRPGKVIYHVYNTIYVKPGI